MDGEHTTAESKTSGRQPFEKLVIGHTRLVETLTRLMSVIRNPCGTSVVLLFGPTRVGKTTLLQKLLRENNARFENEITQDRSIVPSFYVEVVPPSPESGKISWRDLNIRALEELREPHLDKKSAGKEATYNGIYGADIRRALEKALKNRHASLGIYDEAQHLTLVSQPKARQLQQEYLKSLANLSGTMIVLAGTFDILKLLPHNGQLAARMLPIHLSRYRADASDDWRTFREVVLTFQQALPLPDQPDLLVQADLLYDSTFGLVGLLKPWLNRALALVRESGHQTITLRHLQATKLSKPALARIKSEISEGEEKAADYDELGDVFRDVMYSREAAPQSESIPEDSKGKNWPVGQRKAHRDKVGFEST